LNPELAGKAALITAGANGIGFGIAQALAAEGVDLAIGSQDLDPEIWKNCAAPE
jgi:NAD(P)-dependent dehydrogenase (short-subunit alcohol dehydrogenase family)